MLRSKAPRQTVRASSLYNDPNLAVTKGMSRTESTQIYSSCSSQRYV